MEIWSFANATGDVHPMHMHLVKFQVLNRQAFDAKKYMQSGKIVSTPASRCRRNQTSGRPGRIRSRLMRDI